MLQFTIYLYTVSNNPFCVSWPRNLKSTVYVCPGFCIIINVYINCKNEECLIIFYGCIIDEQNSVFGIIV